MSEPHYHDDPDTVPYYESYWNKYGYVSGAYPE